MFSQTLCLVFQCHHMFSQTLCLVYSRVIYSQYLIKFVCCTMLDEMSIRRLTVLEALRTLEAMAGQAVLQIMTWSLCSVVYVKSGSHQLLSIWFVEALIVNRLLFSWRRFLIPAEPYIGSCCFAFRWQNQFLGTRHRDLLPLRVSPIQFASSLVTGARGRSQSFLIQWY